jgi:hypothetical protein
MESSLTTFSKGQASWALLGFIILPLGVRYSGKAGHVTGKSTACEGSKPFERAAGERRLAGLEIPGQQSYGLSPTASQRNILVSSKVLILPNLFGAQMRFLLLNTAGLVPSGFWGTTCQRHCHDDKWLEKPPSSGLRQRLKGFEIIRRTRRSRCMLPRLGATGRNPSHQPAVRFCSLSNSFDQVCCALSKLLQ